MNIRYSLPDELPGACGLVMETSVTNSQLHQHWPPGMLSIGAIPQPFH